MRRRAFVMGMAAVAGAPGVVAAQRHAKMRRLGILAEGSPVSEVVGAAPKATTIRELLARLHELGHRYGETFVTEVRSAEGKLEQFPP
jgi:hypothetical protein